MTSAITATGLRKSFGGKIVLDGIDLEVGAGTTFSLLGPNGAISVDRAGADVDAKTSNGSIRIGEVARSSVVLGTPAGGLEIGIAEGTAARLEVNTGHGHVHNLLENATRPEEAHETVEVRGHTSYGDIAIRRSWLASGTGEEGQP